MTRAPTLRRLEEADLAVLHRWYQTPALWEQLVGAFEPRSEDQAVAYMRRWLTPSATEQRLAICAGERLVGMAALSPIDPDAGVAEFHILLGESDDRGRGLGAAATAEAMRFAFGALGLGRVTLRVLETNAPARRIYERLGFAVQSDAEASVVKRGGPVRVIGMTLTREAFERHQREARSPTR